MTDVLGGAGAPPNPPAPSASSGGQQYSVTYTGHEERRFGSVEVTVDEKTWTFPRDREVEDVPQAVVDALKELEDHNFEIQKGA